MSIERGGVAALLKEAEDAKPTNTDRDWPGYVRFLGAELIRYMDAVDDGAKINQRRWDDIQRKHDELIKIRSLSHDSDCDRCRDINAVARSALVLR